ncbi:hypothetical protein GGS20DRAFT_597865 [Poronia punctata]|nr:hypothetical protein GGS20DRAFT_597865 [Poronia punctata]
MATTFPVWNATGFQVMPVPDVENSRTKHGHTSIIALVVWLLIGLASILLTLRLCYRVFRARLRLWPDDYFLVAALLCLIGNGVTIAKWVPNKLEPNVTTKAPAELVLTGSLMGLFNSLALAFSKTSLAITFMRLTVGWWKSSLGISIFVMSILFSVQAWSYWLQDCEGPPEPFRTQTGAECISFDSIRDFRIVVQILSCFLDAYFTFLPWKIVRPLELKGFEKIGLGIAMSFGCGSLATGLVRLVVLIRLVNEPNEHQPFYAVGGFLFNYSEAGFSIVAACMPVLRKIILDLMQWRKDKGPLPFISLQYWRKKRRVSSAILPLSGSTRDTNSKMKSEAETIQTTLTSANEAIPLSYCSTSSTVVHHKS